MRHLPTWIWLLLAGVFGATASVAWVKNQSRPVSAAEQSVNCLVAKKDIAPATRLGPELVQAAPWRGPTLPKGAFTSVAELAGRVTTFPLVEGELILEKKLAPKGAPPGLTALLPTNKRAMTVKVDETSGVAGFLSPENRVDVLVTIAKGDSHKDPLARVLLQDLRVLGTGQRIETRPGDKPQVVPTVTLEVSPEQGERLALAAQEGRISLVLRGQADDQAVSTRGVNTGNLFGTDEKIHQTGPEPKPAAPSRRNVEIIQGMQRETASF